MACPGAGGRAGSQTRICSFGRYRVVPYTTRPSGTRAGTPTRISSLGPKRHHALDHASLTNVEGMQRKGRFLSVLGPGQYWILEPGTTITPVDVRPNFVTLMGQEVLTADGVPLKVSIAANYEMSDPQLAINGQANYAQALYLLLQLAVREVISTSKADELLENRAGFAEKIQHLPSRRLSASD